MKNRILIIIILLSALGCKKSFLDAKPKTDLLVPKTLDDFTALLDNTTVLNYTSALGQMAADEYVFVSYQTWQATFTATERNSYIWATDTFDGEVSRLDWNRPYISIFYANNVLEALEKSNLQNTAKANQLRGWALFIRAFAYHDLVKTFCLAYNPATANTDLGLPLRLSADIDEVLPRSSLQQTYDLILNDLLEASQLLGTEFPTMNRNRPYKGTSYAMLSRVYLSMNKFVEAEKYADSALILYNQLIDFNTVSQTNASPFAIDNIETIFSSAQVSDYGITINTVSNTAIMVDPELLSTYKVNDLRKTIYFGINTSGRYYFKRGYYGSGNYPFSGIATNEVILNKAECLARRNQIQEAMDVLNSLLLKRFDNRYAYVKLVATSTEEAIAHVLIERRKELIWRGIRWGDIKRLNQIGAGITLKRSLNGMDYILQVNSPKYALPIPEDEISRSGIQQNQR